MATTGDEARPGHVKKRKTTAPTLRAHAFTHFAIGRHLSPHSALAPAFGCVTNALPSTWRANRAGELLDGDFRIEPAGLAPAEAGIAKDSKAGRPPGGGRSAHTGDSSAPTAKRLAAAPATVRPGRLLGASPIVRPPSVGTSTGGDPNVVPAARATRGSRRDASSSHSPALPRFGPARRCLGRRAHAAGATANGAPRRAMWIVATVGLATAVVAVVVLIGSRQIPIGIPLRVGHRPPSHPWPA